MLLMQKMQNMLKRITGIREEEIKTQNVKS